MVPPGLPRPDLLVYATGILELAGAGGLLLRRHTILGGVRSDSADGRHASGERERAAPRD